MRVLMLLILAMSCAAQPTGLEFRGLRLGMDKTGFLFHLDNIAQQQGGGFDAKCDPVGSLTVCTWGLYTGVFSGDKLASLTYRIPAFERPISGFVDAFTRKYGKPNVSHGHYQNGFGATFSGAKFTWRRGTQTLGVAEICSERDEACVTLEDPKLIKKPPSPPI